MSIDINMAKLGQQCRAKFFTQNPQVDAIVTDNPIHIGYLCGYRSVLHDMANYKQAVIATPEQLILVTGSSDAPAALEVIKEPSNIFRYGTFYLYQSEQDTTRFYEMPEPCDDYYSAVAKALEAISPTIKNLGVEFSSAQMQQTISQTLPNTQLTPILESLKKSRAVKLPDEIKLLRYASEITDIAIKNAAQMLEPGISELDIASEITRHMVSQGAIARFVVATSGLRSAFVDAYARNRIIQDNDIIRLDIGSTVNGYCSDMARTYAVGTPEPLMQKRYDALLQGEKAEIDYIRPGVSAADVFNMAMKTVKSAGIANYQRNHCGHGIGLNAHEFPLIGPASETVLEAGMVLSLETPYYQIGWGGMMVEDTVVVTETGCERFTTASSRDMFQYK